MVGKVKYDHHLRGEPIPHPCESKHEQLRQSRLLERLVSTYAIEAFGPSQGDALTFRLRTGTSVKTAGLLQRNGRREAGKMRDRVGVIAS